MMNKRNTNYQIALEYYQKKDYNNALELCSKIIDENPKDFQTFFLIANIFVALEDFQTAQEYLFLALKVKEDYFYPYDLLATIYNKLNKYDLAIEILDLCIQKFYPKKEYDYQMAVTCTNMATLQNKLDNFDLSIQYAKKALKKKKNYFEAYIPLARSYWRKGNFKEAKEYIRLYLKQDPNNVEIGFSYATLLLLNEEYKEGFKYYEYRLQKNLESSTHQLLSSPIYEKKDSLEDKTLCIYQEQGYGDNIQFVRYLNELDNTENISLFVHTSLKKLFQYNFKNIQIIDSIENKNQYDFKLPLLSVPYKFNKLFVKSNPYLKVSPKDIETFANKYIDKNFKNIGIVWTSSQDSDYNEKRIIPLDKMSKLFDIPNSKFYSLQKENNEELSNYSNIVDLGSTFNDFYDTAIAISSLDLIISIDTSVAHLTGALGKEGIVIHHDDIFDFRWATKTDNKSIWYDSLEIIKYNIIEDVIEQIYQKLLK